MSAVRIDEAGNLTYHSNMALEPLKRSRLNCITYGLLFSESRHHATVRQRTSTEMLHLCKDLLRCGVVFNDGQARIERRELIQLRERVFHVMATRDHLDPMN